MRGIVVSAVLSLLVVSTASAQEKKDSDSKAAGLPMHMKFSDPQKCLDGPKVDTLVDMYQDFSQWDELQKALGTALKACGNIAAPTKESPVLVTLIHEGSSYNLLYPQTTRYSQAMPAREETSAVVLMSKDDAARVNGIDLTLITAPTEAGVVGQIPDFVKSIVTAYTAGLKVNMQNVHKFPLPSTDANVTSVAYTPTNIVKLPKFKNATVIEKGFVELRKKDAAAGDESEKAFEKVGIEATFTMTTPVHVELTGVAGAFAGSLRGVDKMKVDSGKYASDPLARSMTMAAVSYRFAPTSVAGVTKTEAQRWAVLGGAVLTPAPGLGGAISRTLIKNLAVNAGWAWMWVPSAPKDLSVDDAVRTEGKQLVYRWTSGLFLGGGYAFGGK